MIEKLDKANNEVLPNGIGYVFHPTGQELVEKINQLVEEVNRLLEFVKNTKFKIKL